MDDQHRRGTRPRLRWNLGACMGVVAIFGLACALARPFVKQAPPSVEVIGIDFDFQETRSPDGQPVMGLAPKITVTKQAGGKAPASKH